MRAEANPARLRDLPSGGGRAAELLREVAAPRALTSTEEAEIAAHLRSLQDGEGDAPAGGRSWQWLAGAAAGLLVFAAFDVALARMLWPVLERHLHHHAQVATVAPASVAPSVAPPAAPPKPARVEAPDVEIEIPESMPSVPAQRRGSSLAREAAALAPAVRSLNQRNPRGALMVLARYHQAFRTGALAGEAAVEEVAADLQLKRPEHALRLLDQLTAPGAPKTGRKGELTVLRGELLLVTGQPRPALAAFAQAQSGALDGPLLERALYGMVVAHSRLGDDAETRTAAERCLAAFPSGRYAAALRGMIGE